MHNKAQATSPHHQQQMERWKTILDQAAHRVEWVPIVAAGRLPAARLSQGGEAGMRTMKRTFMGPTTSSPVVTRLRWPPLMPRTI